jgi:hypothetical protein
MEPGWTVYRTRFLVRARRLTEPLVFTDALGREHTGRPGDYLVESSQGFPRITPREIFEDVYVPLENRQVVSPSSRLAGQSVRSVGLEGSVASPPLAAWVGSACPSRS